MCRWQLMEAGVPQCKEGVSGDAAQSASEPVFAHESSHARRSKTEPAVPEQKSAVQQVDLLKQQSYLVDLADAELQQATIAINSSRDACVHTPAWIGEDLDCLRSAAKLARQDAHQHGLVFRLLVRALVRRVEDAVWTRFKTYESDFRAAVGILIKRLGLVNRQAVSCENPQLHGPTPKAIEKTLINLQLTMSRLQKAASSWISKVHREQHVIGCIVQTPSLMNVYPLAQDAASSLQHGLRFLEGGAIANNQVELLLKSARYAIISSLRSAICAGFDVSSVRTALEENKDALVLMHRARKIKRAPKTYGAALQHWTPTPLESVDEGWDAQAAPLAHSDR